MKAITHFLSLLLLLMPVMGCGTLTGAVKPNTIIRQAEDAPDTFSPPPGLDLDENSCKSPMVDQRDGTEITMVSAAHGMGNYKVPPGKYGVQKGELLRLDCRTGKVLGIVKE